MIFLIDIVFSFNTGFYKKGYLVMKRKDIVINYIKTWFFIDLVASFPYSWFFEISGYTDSIASSDYYDDPQTTYTDKGSMYTTSGYTTQSTGSGSSSSIFTRTP